MPQELTAVFLGVMIGVLTSCFGAVVSYLLYMRQQEERTRGPLVVLFIINGVLGIIGFIAIITSIFVGQLDLALLTGIGIFLGVLLTFAILSFTWVNILSPN